MKYLDEVCEVLSDEVESRYLISRDRWQELTDVVAATSDPSVELLQQAELSYKEYVRASKEYLAIAFKKKFLER